MPAVPVSCPSRYHGQTITRKAWPSAMPRQGEPTSSATAGVITRPCDPIGVRMRSITPRLTAGVGSAPSFSSPYQPSPRAQRLHRHTPDISSLDNVIAVSRSTNQDRFSSGGYGDCMDVLGPTKSGTLAAVTTDRRGISGYQHRERRGLSPQSKFPCPLERLCSSACNKLDYTRCFGGSSFSAPLVAGEAGLLPLPRQHIDPA